MAGNNNFVLLASDCSAYLHHWNTQEIKVLACLVSLATSFEHARNQNVGLSGKFIYIIGTCKK